MSYQIVSSNKVNNKLEVQIKIDEKLWKSEFDKNLNESAKRVSLPGFRKGKVPPEKAKEFVNHAMVLEKTANAVLGKVYDKIIDEKIISEDESVVDISPDVELKNIDKDTAEFVLKFDLIPSIEVPDYKAIPNIKKAEAVTDDDIERQIKSLMKNDAEVITKEDQKIASGNIAIIDFKGIVDGKELPSACANDYELEIGSKTFIPGFEDGLIGLKADEETKLKLKFPDDYHAADIKGKPVVFEVKVKSVKEIKYPELNDEYVKTLKNKVGDKVNTVAELKQYIKETLEKNINQNVKTENLMTIRKYLVDNAKFEYVPEKLVLDHANRIKNQYLQQIERYKLTLKDALAMQNSNEEKFNADIKQEAENNVKYSIMVDKIATTEKIECSDSDIDAKLNDILGPGSNESASERAEMIKRLKEQSGDYIESTIIGDKVLEFIIKQNQKA